MPVGAQDAGAAQTDGFHRPVHCIQPDLVANAERLVDVDGDGAEQIGQRILGGEANGQRADGERRQRAGDIDVQIGRSHQDGDDDSEDFQAFADEREKPLVKGVVRVRRRPLPPHRHGQVD